MTINIKNVTKKKRKGKSGFCLINMKIYGK